jgi:hypothetical protein
MVQSLCDACLIDVRCSLHRLPYSTQKWVVDFTRVTRDDPHMYLRATSHTRLRARDHCTSSTLIGDTGGAGPSLLHTTLEGPTEYVNARWSKVLHGFLYGIQWIMFRGHMYSFQKPSLGGRPNTKPVDHGTPNAHNY